jgi:peptidoglycan/LPS O-acetylase OafA/YrhL
MRLIAAFGIVWFHSHAWGKAISYSALSLFIVFMIVLPLQRPWKGNPARFVLQRADRLLRPWVIWSAIFAGLKIFQAIVQKRSLDSEFEWSMLVMGSQTHLWFLPFGFVCSVAAIAVATSVNLANRLAFPAAVSLAAISIPCSAWLLGDGLPDPWGQWSYGLPAVLFGIAIYYAQSNRLSLSLVSAASVCGFFAALPITDVNWGFESLVLGVNLAIIALSVQFTSRPWMQTAAALSMPVYLTHPIFISILQAQAGLSLGVPLAIFTIALSLAFGAALLNFSWGRKLI